MSDIGFPEHWVDYFFNITEAVRQKSHCPNRKVGAVIVKDKYIIATGYNGVPSKFPHCDVCYGGERVSGHGLDKLPCLHAEENAIIQCAKRGISCDGAMMFVSITPCNICVRKIIQAGIRTVYAKEIYYMDGDDEKLRLYLLENAKEVSGFRMILHQGGLIL